MKGLKMFDAMANIDDSLIDGTYQNTNEVRTNKTGKRVFIYRTSLAAAAVALAIAAVPVVNGILNKTPAVTERPDPVSSDTAPANSTPSGDDPVSAHIPPVSSDIASVDDPVSGDITTEPISSDAPTVSSKTPSSSDPVSSGVTSVPVYTDAAFTAAQIGALFDERNDSEGVGTNAYVKIRVPSAYELKYNCSPLPSGGTVGVYDIKTPSIPASEAGLRVFADKYYNKVRAALGLSAQSYTVQERKYDWDDALTYTTSCFDGTFIITVTENKTSDVITFMNYNGETKLGDLRISVDQTQDDEMMKKSLEPIRKALCELFEVDMRDVAIYRAYDSFSKNGCQRLTVYFYNAQDNGVDIDICRCSDYISLSFDNTENYAGDIVSDKDLIIVSTTYWHFRTCHEELCEKSADAEMISLADAEQLLYNGYVFGGHICPLCMEMQEKVDFEGYDEVGLVYVKGMPFYAFYKDMGDMEISQNGNIIYARTLVPAVKVSGYEEYFEAQKANHRSNEYDIG